MTGLVTLTIGVAVAGSAQNAMVAVRLDPATYLALPVEAVEQVDDAVLQGWLTDEGGAAWTVLPSSLATGARIDRLIASGCGSAVRVGRSSGSLAELRQGTHRGGSWWVFPDGTPFVPVTAPQTAAATEPAPCGPQDSWVAASTDQWPATTQFGLLVARRGDMLEALASGESDARLGRWVSGQGDGLHVGAGGSVVQAQVWDRLVDEGLAWAVLPGAAVNSGVLVRGAHPAPRSQADGEWWLHPRSGAVVWPVTLETP